MKATIFTSLYRPDNGQVVDAISVLRRIGNSDKLRQQVEFLRASEKDKQSKLKTALPVILWSGAYTRREESGIMEYSGLAVFDFDKVEDIAALKEDVCALPYTFAAFISPSGNGLKVLFRFPLELRDYRDYYFAALDYLAQYNPDRATSDPCRACFASYDNDIYINENAELWDKKQHRVQVTNQPEIITDSGQKFSNLLKWLENKGEYWQEGNRNTYLTKLSAGCCRFGIPESDAADLFMRNFPADREFNEKRIAGYFKTAYTKFRGEYASVQFERSSEAKKWLGIDISTGEDVSEKVLIAEPFKDNIYASDVTDKLWRVYEEGHGLGLSTGISALDAHFNLGRGRLVVFGGIPQHGKSAFANNLMMLQAMKSGIKWQIYGPESYPAEDYYLDLIQIYCGSNVLPGYADQIDKYTYEKAIDFVNQHFIYVYPKDDAPSPDYIIQRFEENIIDKGIGGCLIDPFNQLDNDMKRTGGREDLYISNFASQYKKFGQVNDVFTWVVVHPNSDSKPMKGEKEPPMPTQFNLAGGPMWNNKADDIVIIHRPFRETAPHDTTVLFESKKIKKQRQYGRPGQVELHYEPRTGRYNVSIGGRMYDPFPDTKSSRFSVHEEVIYSSAGRYEKEGDPF